MMPDKIYIHQNISRSDVVSLSFPDDKGRGIEFIRKEALLEWAKAKQYESLTIVADNFWQEVIDKLNSL